jgi:predicted ArsR family transcriptional regulator
MHSTKTEILAHLKRHDGSTVDGIASSLNLAPMTVRQHLTALERDGAVRSEEVRRPTGRPHFRYLLTEDGHRRLADGWDRLLGLLVEQFGLLEPNGAEPMDRRERLFRSAAAALAARHADEVRALPAIHERVERAVAILRKFGGFPEYHDLGDGVEIRDFACVYREVVSRAGTCAWHETFLSALLGMEIRSAEEPAECAMCCRYVVMVPVGVSTGMQR